MCCSLGKSDTRTLGETNQNNHVMHRNLTCSLKHWWAEPVFTSHGFSSIRAPACLIVVQLSSAEQGCPRHCSLAKHRNIFPLLGFAVQGLHLWTECCLHCLHPLLSLGAWYTRHFPGNTTCTGSAALGRGGDTLEIWSPCSHFPECLKSNPLVSECPSSPAHQWGFWATTLIKDTADQERKKFCTRAKYYYYPAKWCHCCKMVRKIVKIMYKKQETESQNGWCWKGSWDHFVCSPLLRLSYLCGVAQGYIWLGFGYLQGWRLHSLFQCLTTIIVKINFLVFRWNFIYLF